jgi:branched-chain amino acid transport system substrate-binding protein
MSQPTPEVLSLPATPAGRARFSVRGLRAAALLGSAALALAAMGGVAKAQDIKIGMVTPLTGAAAESGRYAQWGAQLAVDEVNKAGGVMGHKLTLVIEDDQTTNPGVVAAFNRLSNDPTIAVFLGSIRSTQVHAMDPDVRRVAKPVFIGGTDPTLTHAGDSWLFRCRPNDSYSAKVIAAYGTQDLHLKKWALIYSSDAFGTNGAKNLEEQLKASGAQVVTQQSYSNQTADFTPVVLAVKSSGADGIGSYFTFESDLGIFARQARQLGVRSPWIGSPSIVDTAALHLGGASLNGTFGVADYTPDSSPEARAYNAAYEAAHKLEADNQSSWTYDAVQIAALAMKNANSTDPQKLHDAILAIKGFKGAEGTYDFDANGDGLHGYNVVKNVNGKIAFIKRIDFDH